jgi:hypothetical protein
MNDNGDENGSLTQIRLVCKCRISVLWCFLYILVNGTSNEHY